MNTISSRLRKDWDRTSTYEKFRLVMWTLMAGFLILAVMCLTGCASTSGPNPQLTPAAITGDVRDAVQIGLDVYPKASHDVALARDIICKESGSANFTSAQILSDLESAGIENSNSKLIIDGVLLIWNRVQPYVGTNVQAYSSAICLGMQEGTGSTPAARKAVRALPPHLK